MPFYAEVRVVYPNDLLLVTNVYQLWQYYLADEA